MKSRIIFFVTVIVFSIFMISSVSAQETKKEIKKTKTELTKKEIPPKCLNCPNFEKCHGKKAADSMRAVYGIKPKEVVKEKEVKKAENKKTDIPGKQDK